VSGHAISELDRRLGNLVRMGTITELDQANARVKVDLGDSTTEWLPWVTARAGATRTWSAPRPGEQVMVLAPSGELAQGVVLPSIFQDAHPAPSNTQDVEHTEYPDGTTVDYNSATNTLTVTVAAAGNVVINCKHATVNADQDATVTTQLATVNASTKVELATPLVHCTQALTVEGLITGNGGLSVSGGSGAVVDGDFRAQNGAFTHNSKNVGSTHTHTGVQSGGGITGAPS
jgi:phage baseplate assembly protein V